MNIDTLFLWVNLFKTLSISILLLYLNIANFPFYILYFFISIHQNFLLLLFRKKKNPPLAPPMEERDEQFRSFRLDGFLEEWSICQELWMISSQLQMNLLCRNRSLEVWFLPMKYIKEFKWCTKMSNNSLI